MTPSTWLTRALLLAFPKAFRERLGRQLVQTLLTDSRAPSGRIRPVRFAIGAADVVRAGLAERMAVRRRAQSDRRRGRSWPDAWWQDVRQAARRLASARGFTFVAVLTLALGVGVNAALFQLLDAVRLRPLPIPSPEELVEIRIRSPEGARGNFSIWHAGATNAIWEQIRARQDAFSSVFAWTGSGVRLTADGIEPRFANALLMSGESFSGLGLTPALGRLLTAEDDTRGCPTPGVVLSHAFWHTEFGRDPAIVGRRIVLGRDTYHVVGVAPREFTGLEVGRRFDVALPLCAEWLPPGSVSRLDSGVEWFLIVMGRLKPGWTVERARAHLASISPAVFEASLPSNYPAESVARYRGFQLTAIDVSRGISLVREQYSAALWFLQATAVLVLLVGCANLANLMLARVATREREIAARLALGASRGQIFRLLLIESVLLSVTGTVAGAWLARPMSLVLIKFIDGGTDSLFLSLAPDWRLLAFASLAGALTCILSGVTPAWRAGSISPGAVVRTGGRALTESRGGVGLRRGLVMAQVALSFVLLFGALLFTRNLANLATQQLGLQPDGLTIAYVDMSGAKIPVTRRAEFRRILLNELTSTPGVVSAAETSVVPLSGGASDNDVWLDGAREARALSFFVDIGGAYFDTVGMSLVSGRTFNDAVDVPGSPAVVVVNEAFAKAFAGGGNPVGRRLWREAGADRAEKSYDIVGLVTDAKYQHLRQDFRPTIYVAASQHPRPPTFAQLLIRTTLRDDAATATLKSAFGRAGPGIVPTFQSFSDMVGRSLAQDQLLAALSGLFGVLAVLLATLGLYGSISFAVARRTREIGVRVALGADRHRILSMVLREASWLIVAGCAAGGALSVWFATYVGTLIYQLERHDPISMIGATVLLAGVGLGASFVPASRAARLDPMTAWRID